MKKLPEFLSGFSAEEKEKYDQKGKEWERSNGLSLLIMKHTISSDVMKAIPDSVNTKEYLAFIEKHFQDLYPLKSCFKGLCYKDSKR